MDYQHAIQTVLPNKLADSRRPEYHKRLRELLKRILGINYVFPSAIVNNYEIGSFSRCILEYKEGDSHFSRLPIEKIVEDVVAVYRKNISIETSSLKVIKLADVSTTIFLNSFVCITDVPLTISISPFN